MNLSYIETCSEGQLFSAIYNVGGALWSVQHDLADGRYESTPEIEEWLETKQEEIGLMVDQTSKFGVPIPREKDGRATDEYWVWYHSAKKSYFNIPPLIQAEKDKQVLEAIYGKP